MTQVRKKWSFNCVQTHDRIKISLQLWILKVVSCIAGGVPARPLPRPQDAGQAAQRQQKDQHDQVPFC